MDSTNKNKQLESEPFEGKGKKPGDDRKPGNSKGKKKYYRREFQKGKKIRGGDDMRSDNDRSNPPELYYPDENIGKAIANLPYNIPTGMKFPPYSEGVSTTHLKKSTNATIPILMRIDYVAGYGSFSGAVAAINTAARAMDTVVRKANSGSKNYESSDLMTYFMAMDQIYVRMLRLRKILRLTGLFDFMNRGLPKTIVEMGCGINYSDLVKNYANYRGKFNLLVRKINMQFAVPNTFKLFVRRAIMEDGIFGDSTSARGQAYIFNLRGYYQWTGTQPGGSALKFKTLDWDDLIPHTFLSELESVEADVDALVGVQDIATMSGDVLKAFGEDRCFSLVPLKEDDYITSFTMNEDVLSQIENATILGGTVSGNTFVTVGDIIQENNLLSCSCKVLPSNTEAILMANLLSGDRPINSHKDDPTFKDNFEYTRLMASLEFKNGQTSYYEVNFTSELVWDAVIITTDYDNQGLKPQYHIQNTIGVLTLLPTSGATINQARAIQERLVCESFISNFDWHPLIKTVIDYNQTIASWDQMQHLPIHGDFKVAASI